MDSVTINITESSSLVQANITEQEISVTVNVVDPNLIDEITFSSTAPSNPHINKLWIQTP